MASSPRIFTQTFNRRRQTPDLRRRCPLAVHRPSACSGVKALRNTSNAKRQSRQAMLAFRSLDPFRALREPDRRRRDEERLSRSEQRTLSKTQNNHLTGKAPYKFESISLQRRVHCEPDFLDPDKSCFWLRGRLPSCLSARRIARAGAALEAVPGPSI